jgi:toxin CcdB
MEQFDICPIQGSGRDGRQILAVILQHRFAKSLETCVVAPMVPLEHLPRVERLRPMTTIDGRDYVIAVDRLAAIERRTIGPAVGSVGSLRQDLIAAVDLLFTGF